MNSTARRISYIFLCAVPFLDLVIVGVRAFRVPGVYQAAGVVYFSAIAIAAWIVGARAIADEASAARRLALTGVLLVTPFSIVGLLWVGLGAPFQATAFENHMRYLVLLANAIVIASAFVLLKEELDQSGERFYSTIGFAANITAGSAYFVCITMSLAGSALVMRGAPTSPSADFSNELYSGLEFVACVMTYVTTAAFASALGRARWLGRVASRIYVAANLFLLLLVVVGGVSYPEISGRTAPWYTRPGVIARIPAIPWLMPCLLGVVLLRRAGDAHRLRSAG